MKLNATIPLFCPSPLTRSYCWLYTSIAILLVLITSADSYAQSRDRDNPTVLTSGEISGVINNDSKANFYYYTFTANPGEVSITLSVQPDPPSGTYVSFQGANFTLYDRDAEAILRKSVTASYSSGTGQVVGRVNITRRQTVILGIGFSEVISGTGKYRVRISGTVEFPAGVSNLGQIGSTVGGLNTEPPIARIANDKKGDCLPKQGTLIVKMKDGTKKIIDLSEAEEVTIVP